MTVFWKPMGPAEMGSTSSKDIKVLGRAVYARWCRCDLCYRSGPCSQYVLLARNDDTGEICFDCYQNGTVAEDLRLDSWERR